jgi:hypothetical protein
MNVTMPWNNFGFKVYVMAKQQAEPGFVLNLEEI